jgi:hypothetical protein
MPNKLTRKERLVQWQALQHNGRKYKIIFSIVAVVVIGLTGFLLFNALYKPPLPADGNVIDISADMGGFDKNVITVKVGQPVTAASTNGQWMNSMSVSSHRQRAPRWPLSPQPKLASTIFTVTFAVVVGQIPV